MANARIVLDGVRKRYDRMALDGLSLRVEAGEAYGLLGRNGAGKTTAVRILLGADPDFDGEARLLGADSHSLPLEVRRRIGAAVEGQALPDALTVGETIAFVSRLYPTWDVDHAESLQRRLGLDSSQRVGSLSRGTRAKLGLLLATPFRPEALVLDDISGGLDVPTRRELMSGVVEALTREGSCVLFSSHVLTEAERIADRIGILRGGRLVAEGTPEQIRASVRRVRAEFVGPVPGRLGDVRGLRTQAAGASTALLTSRTADADPRRVAKEAGAAQVIDMPLDLEEVFLELTREEGALEEVRP